MYFDAISYDQTALEGLAKLVGPDRIMFGTGMCILYHFELSSFNPSLTRQSILPSTSCFRHHHSTVAKHSEGKGMYSILEE